MDYQFLKFSVDDKGVAEVRLNRPEIHNAFNDKLIEEITHIFQKLNTEEDVRLVVLTGEGKSFCAGADLNWMSSMVNYSQEENKKDSLKLSQMFKTLDNFSKIIIGKINGHALGGGVGLVAVCDYAITHERAKFGFTEVRLGLAPAVISPYCVRKVGEANARAWFLSGEMFEAEFAKGMNLVQEVTSLENYENRSAQVVQSFLKAGPKATAATKSLIKNILNLPKEDIEEYTCATIAKLRVSEEGQEGMQALLNKSKPKWM